jgi:hypothetical protein
MAAQSNALENQLIDGIFRGGAVNSSGTVNSTAVVTGVWAATTAYTAGQVVAPPATFTAGGGKFLQCTTGGTSGSTTTLACPAIGSTLTDGTVTWTAVSAIPCPLYLYIALFVISNGLRSNLTAYTTGNVVSLTANGGSGGDTKQHLYRCTTAGTTAASQSGYAGIPGEVVTDGTAVFTEMSPVLQAGTGFPSGFNEVTGGSYARVALNPSLANWAGTQAAGSTTASTGTSATTSNNSPITFPAPTAAWATGTAAVGGVGIYTALTGGTLLSAAPLTVPKTVNNGDAAPSYATGALQFQIDN